MRNSIEDMKAGSDPKADFDPPILNNGRNLTLNEFGMLKNNPVL